MNGPWRGGQQGICTVSSIPISWFESPKGSHEQKRTDNKGLFPNDGRTCIGGKMTWQLRERTRENNFMVMSSDRRHKVRRNKMWTVDRQCRLWRPRIPSRKRHRPVVAKTTVLAPPVATGTPPVPTATPPSTASLLSLYAAKHFRPHQFGEWTTDTTGLASSREHARAVATGVTLTVTWAGTQKFE